MCNDIERGVFMDTNVQVRMKEKTLKQTSRLQERVGAPSRSDTIRRAIELSDLITREAQHGSKIIIETKGGKQKQILIPNIEIEDD